MVTSLRCAALLRPGLGKTTIAQSALVRLNSFPALVVAPAQVVESGVWSQEALAWEHTRHLVISELSMSAEGRELELMLGADITVVSYELLRWLTARISQKRKVRNNRYKAIVYDELQKMKHPGTRRFMRMRHWAQDIEVRFGLTGSPMGNHWLDLFGEMFILAGEKPLGPTLEQYQQTYFNQVFRAGAKYPVWELRSDGSAEEIRQRIRPYAFSVTKKLAASELPEVVSKEMRLNVPHSCRVMEEKLRAELEVELRSGKTLVALNGSKLAAAIRQFASGAVYTNEERTEWEELHTAKVEAIEDLVDELQGEPLLVFTWFRHAAERLRLKFKGAEHFVAAPEQVERWNQKRIPLMTMNPQSGLGQNLQRGSSSVCWMDLPFSRELFDQGNGRVARLGQPDPYVSATVLLAGAIDRRIWSALQRKGEDEASVIEAVAL